VIDPARVVSTGTISSREHRRRRSRVRFFFDSFVTEQDVDRPPFSMDVELLYMSFSDPICREILKMRLEGYSVEEIARHCNLSTRTVERRLQDIRLHYSTFLGP
jgi:DNA-directed RNA polymerase specialized sigma24 family protein